MLTMRFVPHRRDLDAGGNNLHASAQLGARLVREPIAHPERIFLQN
jgi:hypothetical protein